MDGHNGVCKFSQPTGMCTGGVSLYVADTVSGAVRILTSLLPLKSYIEAVRPLYSEFGVHSIILGSSSSRDISAIITSLEILRTT